MTDPRITVTLDVEDHLGQYGRDARYIANTQRILAFLAERKVRGTFFVVGRVAETAPALVREIASAGHEIACHSQRHMPLDRETSESFRTGTARAKEALEQAAGVPVEGYRAPIFSLTARTRWAVDELATLGFRYSSSVLPAANPLYGFPGAPRAPFRWPNGLVEFPVPLAQAGPARLPYLGGIYLRYLPGWLIRRWARARTGDVLWTYLHPYDFDSAEPYAPMPDTATWVSVLLWLNRGGTWDKLAGLIAMGTGKPLGDTASDSAFAAGLPVMNPDPIAH
jgi:peptidoglycan-N-acetylglucosamine deacetylase